MRPLADWNESDLQEPIDNSVQESLVLDYKASSALTNDSKCRNDLSKDVSAFANSAGGRLIYGISELKSLPSTLDRGVDPSLISREWIEQVINTQISPRIPNVVIKQILLSTGNVAYVVDIPQGTSVAPHQANDKKYYRRFNFQSVPMEDHEVRDVMRRSTTPDLYAALEVVRRQRRSDGFEAAVNVMVGNRSPTPATYAIIRVFADVRLKARTYDSLWLPSGDLVEDVYMTTFKRQIRPQSDLPIYQEENTVLGDIVLTASSSGRYKIGYSITCPGFSTVKLGTLTNNNEQFALNLE